MQSFAPEGIDIPVDRLLRLQGYRDPERVRPRIRAMAEAMAESARALLAAEARFRRVSIAACGEATLDLAAGTRFHSRRFHPVLAPAREALVFVLTLGAPLDEAVDNHMTRDEMVEALFLDNAGWLAIEQATRRLATHLGASLRPEALRLSRRLAPGYGDWPLEEQAALLALFEPAPLPVQLLESCAMVPKKSRTGLYGLLPQD